MGILKLTEYVIEYLLISSTLLLLMGILSIFMVTTFRVKGAIKIFLYTMVFILPVIYPVRSLVPESIRIPLVLKSEYIKPLINTETQIFLIPDVSLPSGSETITGGKDNRERFNIKGETSHRGLKEGLMGTLSQLAKNWKLVAAVTWLLIFSIYIIRLIASFNATKRLLMISTPVTDQTIMRLLHQCASETGISHIPQIYITHSISSPMVTGFIKPVIVIPAHLLGAESPVGLRFALLHELKHIQQHHNLWLLVESVIGAAYFFHPVIIWVKRKIREELENICDRHVINITNKKATYAGFLLNEIWQHNHSGYSALSLPFITATSKTANRIHTILENRVASASMSASEKIVAFSVLVVFSSLIFFTIVPVSQKADFSQGSALSNNIVTTHNHKPAQMNEQTNPSPVLSHSANDETVEIHPPLVSNKNEMGLDRSEYNVKIPVKHLEAEPVKQMNAQADHTDSENTTQQEDLYNEQPEQMSDNHINDMDLKPLTGNLVSDTSVETPSSPEALSQKYLGSPVNELTIHRIDNIKVLDQYTILFIMRGRAIFLTRLKEPCPALLYANDFNLDSLTGKISKFDRIQAISHGQILGTTGMLSEFYPYKYEGSEAEAINLLKKELLKIFVTEGALNPT